MSFGWLSFLNSYGIHYVTYGKNTRAGEVSIACPLCGDDPSEHLGIDPKTGSWSCWRNREHSGKKPFKLVSGLLGCSYSHARMVVEQYSRSDPDSFDDIDKLLDAAPVDKKFVVVEDGLCLPDNFKTPKRNGSTNRYWEYLYDRGFDDVDDLIDVYSIKCCSVGEWKDRVILPIYLEGKLVTWTGRAIINPIGAPRYKTLSAKEGSNPRAIIPITETLLGYSNLISEGGTVLVLEEGPIDALKLDYYGYNYGVRATCFFTLNMTPTQHHMITKLVKRFKKTLLLLDANEIAAEFRLMDDLAPLGVEAIYQPSGFKDAGELSPKQARGYVESLLKKL
jgi:hypothetical protein